MSLVTEMVVELRSSRYWQFVSNLSWLTADKVVRLGVGLLVGVAIARYLRPEGFGTLNYAYALVALISVFAGLGLDAIVQRDLIRNQESKGQSLATCLGLRMFAGILAYTLLYILLVAQPIDDLAKRASLIIGLSLLNGFTPTFDTWFQSQVRAKFSVYAQNAAFLLASAVRIWMILSRKSLLAFAWAAVIEAFLAALFLWMVFAKQERDWEDWRFNWRLAKRWLSESWTLLLSSLAIMIYMRIDQVMLARMADVHAVGVYSAAVRVSEIGYFIPMMLASTLLPSIVRSRSLPQTEYQAKRQRFFDLNSVVAFAVIVPGAILAKWIIQLLYGATYSEAVSILVIHIWSALFVFTGVARGQYLLSENLLRFSLYSTVAGAVLNIALNFILIPRNGALGAAWATLIAYAISAFVSSFFYKPAREMGWQQAKSFALPLAVLRLATQR